MSAPTIRAALEAAGRALCFGQNGLDCDTCLTADQCRKPGSWNVEAANTVAAFLRQMDHVACGDGFTFASLADAVERAAKEVGNG